MSIKTDMLVYHLNDANNICCNSNDLLNAYHIKNVFYQTKNSLRRLLVKTETKYYWYDFFIYIVTKKITCFKKFFFYNERHKKNIDLQKPYAKLNTNQCLC